MADSSYIVDNLLSKSAGFEGEEILVPDVAVPEVMNAIYVQQHVLHLIEDGLPFIDALYEIVEARLIQIVGSSRALVREAYEIAGRNGGATYDCLFVALALRSDMELRTRDRRQAKILETERARRLEEDPGGKPPDGTSRP